MHKKSAIVRLPFTTLMDKDKKDVLNITTQKHLFLQTRFLSFGNNLVLNESSDYFNLNLQY